MNFDTAFDRLIGHEGGYSNHPDDPGGETMWGVTASVARANGYTGPMKDLTRDFARGVYNKQYVVAPGFDKIAAISPSIGAELVDTGVNMGPKVAAQFLQRALNGLNNQGKDYTDVLVDGAAGQKTRDALTAFLKKRGAEGERRLLMLLNALQGERYLSLSEGRSANEAFLFGWLARIAA